MYQHIFYLNFFLASSYPNLTLKIPIFEELATAWVY